MKFLLSLALLFVSLCLHAQNAGELKEVRLYHPNGALKVKATELNGEKHGLAQTFYDNGIQRAETHWKNGIQTGETKRWYRNGKLDYTGFVEGQETGEWKYYDDLDGKLVYSMTYQNGVIKDYHIPENKYHWRKITMGGYKIDVQFPLPIMDSLTISESMKGCFTMYPYRSKRELDYYGLFTYDKNILTYDPDVLFSDFKVEYLWDNLGSIFYSADTSRPSFISDKCSLVTAKKITLKSHPAYELKVLFTDLELSFECLLIPYEDRYYLVFGYFRKEVSALDRAHYFSSVSFK